MVSSQTCLSISRCLAALNLALKNYDKENWANDPQLLELKREELRIQKEQDRKKQLVGERYAGYKKLRGRRK